jgi:hypothetical protein
MGQDQIWGANDNAGTSGGPVTTTALTGNKRAVDVHVGNPTSAPVPISDAGGSITVDGTVAVSGSVGISPITSWTDASQTSVTAASGYTIAANANRKTILLQPRTTVVWYWIEGTTVPTASNGGVGFRSYGQQDFLEIRTSAQITIAPASGTVGITIKLGV